MTSMTAMAWTTVKGNAPARQGARLPVSLGDTKISFAVIAEA